MRGVNSPTNHPHDFPHDYPLYKKYDIFSYKFSVFDVFSTVLYVSHISHSFALEEIDHYGM